MTILSSDHPRIILGLSSNRFCIGGSNSEGFRCNLELAQYLLRLEVDIVCAAHWK